MPKTPLAWRSNPDKDVPVVPYSSGSVTYNSPTTHYSGADTSLDTFDKLAASWSKVDKQSANWEANPAFTTNEYAYDTTALYDSATRTYDGVVPGEGAENTKEPAVWAVG